MSAETKIEWATHTWNPWEGCTKVSPGCANCYAAARNHRFGMDNWGKGKPRRRTSAALWRKPIQWDTAVIAADNLAMASDGPCGEGGARPRVFPSLCDWLDEEAPIEWLADFLKLIHDTPNLDWLLLTKRPENWHSRIDAAFQFWWDKEAKETGSAMRENSVSDWIADWIKHQAPSNIWIGVSVEDQARADERIPELLKIPARLRFLSVEPLLGPVDISEFLWESGCTPHCGDKCSKDADCPMQPRKNIWPIVGGESGRHARVCDVEWIDDLRRQCRAADVPCFIKQLGSNCATQNANVLDWPAATEFIDCHCHEGAAAGHVRLGDAKGGDMREWPTELRVREFPTTDH